MTVIIFIILFSLPIAILIDSKMRLGKYKWGWAIFSLISYMGVISYIGKSISGKSRTGALIGYILGGLTGGWAGAFPFIES
jgi:hypothetical protein